MNNNQQLQDPTTKKVYEFLTLGSFLGIVIWAIWIYFYLNIPFIQCVTLLLDGKKEFSEPFFMMCLITGGLLSAYWFKHLVNDTSKEKHQRGARFEE